MFQVTVCVSGYCVCFRLLCVFQVTACTRAFPTDRARSGLWDAHRNVAVMTPPIIITPALTGEHVVLPDQHQVRREGNVLLNDALNTFYLLLYGVGNITLYLLCSVYRTSLSVCLFLSPFLSPFFSLYVLLHFSNCSLSPLSYFSFQPVLHDWCNKGHGMCYPVCGMTHIKEPFAANRKE